MKLRSASRTHVSRIVDIILLLGMMIGSILIGEMSAWTGKAQASSSAASIGGCPLFPGNNIWNHDISTLPVHHNWARIKSNKDNDMPKRSDHSKQHQESSIAPRKTGKQWAEEGDLHLKQKDYSEALVAYKEALKRDPGMVRAHIGKGDALYELGRYQSALRAFERAIQLKPKSVEAHNGKGNALMMLDYNEEALEELEKAIQLDPENSNSYNNMAYILSMLDREEDALVAYDKAIQLDPTNAKAYNSKAILLSFLD